MRKYLFLYIILFIINVFSVDAWAWNDGKTHPKITARAIRKSIINEFLNKRLNMPKGWNEELKLKGQSFDREVKDEDDDFKTEHVFEWLDYGSFKEDDPMCRAGQHFHDPIHGYPTVQTWPDSGLHDYVDILGNLVEGYCELTNDVSIITGSKGFDPDDITSNITWATGIKDPAHPEGKDTKNLNLNDWDWEDARNDLYTYLTGRGSGVEIIAGNQVKREYYLMRSLRSLGQVLHLLQDVGVPAHTRNDFSTSHTHFIKEKFYDWFKEWPPTLPGGNYFEEHVAYHPFDLWFNQSFPTGLTNPSLTDFWDTNSYDGYYQLANTGVGLAEYTNYNYISENTAFKPFADDHYYPNPKLSATTYENVKNGTSLPQTTSGDSVYANNKSIQLSYTTSHGETIDSFARASYWTTFVGNSEHFDEAVYQRTFWLDEGCYDNYANYIIPRTIGYSTELINYFFRGKIDMSVKGFDTRTNPSTNKKEIIEFTIAAKNVSDNNEAMENGKELMLAIKYKKFTDSEYSYITVAQSGEKNIGRDSQDTFVFDLSNNPLPIDAQDIFINLVYKGDLGAEKDVAIAVGGVEFCPAIKITLPDNGYYAMSTNQTMDLRSMEDQGFNELQFMVENVSPDGVDMTGGDLTLEIDYKMPDSSPWESPQPSSYTPADPVVFSQPEGINFIIPKGESRLKTYKSSSTIIPFWATDVTLTLTYSVNGKTYAGYKDISETTPIAFANVTNSNCLYDKLIYSDPMATTLDGLNMDAYAVVRKDDDGQIEDYEWDIFEHNVKDINIRLSPANNPQMVQSGSGQFADEYNTLNIPLLKPGWAAVLFVLTDSSFNLAVEADYEPIYSADKIWAFTNEDAGPDTYVMHGREYHRDTAPDLIEAVVNQAPFGDESRRHPTPLKPFKKIKAIDIKLFDNLPIPVDSHACDYNEDYPPAVQIWPIGYTLIP